MLHLGWRCSERAVFLMMAGFGFGFGFGVGFGSGIGSGCGFGSGFGFRFCSVCFSTLLLIVSACFFWVARAVLCSFACFLKFFFVFVCLNSFS